ncbi:MAG: hypothetical protein ABIF40_05470 [archaeon]
MLYILRQLRGIEDPIEFKQEAKRLLEYFHELDNGEIPRGFFIPEENWPTVNETSKKLDKQQQFFEEMDELLGKDRPKIYEQLSINFARSKAQMLELSEMHYDERMIQSNSDLPPYCYDFDWAVKRDARNPDKTLPKLIEQATFSPDLVGRGGFGEVYRGQSSDNQDLALKIFHIPWKFNSIEREKKWSYAQKIKNNIRRKQEIFSQEPFAKLLYVFPDNVMSGYIMEFFRGSNFTGKKVKNIAPTTSKQVLLTYAKMLEMLHTQDMIYLDNKWGNILFKDQEIVICDYDFVSTIEEANKPDFFGQRIKTAEYVCQEQLLGEGFKPLGDLESFALMIDTFYIGNRFLTGYTAYDVIKRQLKPARQNKRIYPQERQKQIPAPLRDIVSGLITYPRDDSFTATDFVSAIQEVYK